MLAGVFKRPQIYYYVNGKLIGSGNANLVNYPTYNGYTICQYPWHTPFLHGYAGDVMVFHRALSGPEIASIYQLTRRKYGV